MEIYVVRSGDTVYSIAQRFGVSVQRLVSDNSLSHLRELALGQALLILKPEIIHRFRYGESLFSIAEMYGTSVNALYRNNPVLIGQPYIPEGAQIVITYEDKPTEPAEVSGFAYEFINRRILEAALPYLTYLIVFGYGFTEEGEIITVNDSGIITLAHSFDTSVFLSLTSINVDGSFGSAKIERLLTDMEFQNRVIDGFIRVILERGAQGLDIDMEYIPPQFKTEYAAFAENAASRLNPLGLKLHVDLAPKTSAEQTGTLYEAHDYGLLGAAADYVFLMTYEWGYKHGPPMAVAPLPSVRRVLEYGMTEIPADKIFLGIPNYCYDWALPYERGESEAVTMGNTAAVRLAVSAGSEILFDGSAQSPYFYYTDSAGTAHVVWFEDVRSLKAKYELVSEKKLRGCGYWNLMRPFPQNYLLLNGMFKIIKNFGG